MSIMVLVDTTVWIEFFSGRSLPHVKALEDLLVNRKDLCISGIILTEVLQGIRGDSEFDKTRDLFSTSFSYPCVIQPF
jgi:predicted nucleic acid-binding protein